MLAESEAGAIEDLGPAFVGKGTPLQEIGLAKDKAAAAGNGDLRGQAMRPGRGFARRRCLAVLELKVAPVLEAGLIGDARTDGGRKPGHKGIQLNEVVAEAAVATAHYGPGLNAGRRIPAHAVVAQRQGIVVANAPIKLGEGDHLVAPAQHRPGKALQEGQAGITLGIGDAAYVSAVPGGESGLIGAGKGEERRAAGSSHARKVTLLLIVAEEEEEPVLDECASQGSTELVALVGGLEMDCGWGAGYQNALRGEGINSPVVGIAVVVKGDTMQSIAPALGHRIDHTTGGASILGG